MNKTAILINSCDAYADIWDPFFYCLRRFWPDCPYRIYLLAGEKSYSYPNLVVLGDKLERDWGGRTLRALNQIEEEHLLVIMEDYLLQEPIDTRRIRKLEEYSLANDIECLRLFPCPGPDGIHDTFDPEEVGWLSAGAPYRVSLQAAFWQKQAFHSLLRFGESPWDFEMRGGPRSQGRAFLATVQKAFPYYCTAVVKGLLESDAVAFLKSIGYPTETLTRRIR